MIEPIQSSSDSSNDEDSETDSSDSSPSRNSNQSIPQNRNEKKRTKKVKVADKETKDRIGKRNRNSQSSPENDQPKKIVIIEELDQNEISINSSHPTEVTKTQEHATRVTMPHFVLDEHVLIMTSRPINCQLVHSSPNISLQTEKLKHSLTDKNNQQTGSQNEKYT